MAGVRAAGSCSILQQMPCNLHPNESHLPSPATCCPGLQLIYCALGCSQRELQYSKSFCSILQGDRAQPQPLPPPRQSLGPAGGRGAAAAAPDGDGDGDTRGPWAPAAASCWPRWEDAAPSELRSSPGTFRGTFGDAEPPVPPSPNPRSWGSRHEPSSVPATAVVRPGAVQGAAFPPRAWRSSPRASVSPCLLSSLSPSCPWAPAHVSSSALCRGVRSDPVLIAVLSVIIVIIGMLGGLCGSAGPVFGERGILQREGALSPPHSSCVLLN